MTTDILTIAKTCFRSDARLFGISTADRLLHMYLLGQTGTGKTTLIEYLVTQDIRAGRGCAVFDPHGDLVQSLTKQCARTGKRATILTIADRSSKAGYNPIRRVPESLRPLLASGVLDVFKKLWADAWGVRMEHILRNTLLTLLDQPSASLADIPRILTNSTYRKNAITHITNPHVRAFWEQEFNSYAKRHRAEIIAPILNKVGGFLAHPATAAFLTEPKNNISLRTIMDEGGVLLINLSKGTLGEDASHLIGSLMMTSIGLAALSRADLPEAERKPFFLYADEFHNVTTLSIVTMTSELRKYGLGVVFANQYLDQLTPEIRSAIIGNVATLICFRLGADDAYTMAKEFYPACSQHDLMNLNNHHVYIKLLHAGKPTKAFSARTVRVI